MNMKMNSESTRKIGNPKLEVIRFNSADVIATSADPFMLGDKYEMIVNPTVVSNFNNIDNLLNSTSSYYNTNNEP